MGQNNENLYEGYDYLSFIFKNFNKRGNVAIRISTELNTDHNFFTAMFFFVLFFYIWVTLYGLITH